MGSLASVALKLFAPGAIVAIALAARPLVTRLSPEPQVLLDYLPYLLAAANVVVGYQFGRLRIVLAAACLALFYWLVQTHLQTSLQQPQAERLFLAVGIGLPLLTICLILLPERGILNPRGMSSGALFVGLALLCLPLIDTLAAADGPAIALLSTRNIEGYALSVALTVAIGAVFALGLILVALRPGYVEAALSGALLSTWVCLGWFHLGHISMATGIAAQCCLGWGLLRSSHAMAYRDELTGLLSRRALNERLKTLGRSYSIAMLDIDHFKRFNDTHGHEVGDEVLRLVASRVGRVGEGGTAYRYGGEEFCIVFPRRSAEDCAVALEALRENIAGYRLSIRDRKCRPRRAGEGARRRGATRLRPDQVSVTVSVGVAARDASYPDPVDVIKAADSRLYRAKKAGRNRVMC